MEWVPTWENIAYSDKFRTADTFTQQQIRSSWMNQVAPKLYPAVAQNPLGKQSLWNYTNEVVLPDKAPDEDLIIQPKALSMDNYSMLESNPAFGKKSFDEQLQYRNIWLKKMANQDPEFKALAPEEQNKFATDFMRRYPSGYGLEWTGNTVGMNYQKEHVQKEWLGIVDSNKTAAQFLSYSEQAMSNVAGGATTIVTGPLLALSKVLFGEHNDFAAAFDQYKKNSDWMRYTSEANNPLPGFVGSLVGLAVSPFPKFEKFLAGGFKIAPAAGKLAVKVTSEAGLLEKIGVGLGAKLPSYGYQVAGGAIAGGVLGITQALQEGKDWNAYIGQDATLGVAFELISRGLALRGQFNKAARQMGVKASFGDLTAKMPGAGGTSEFTPEFIKIIKADPRSEQLLNLQKLVNKNGLLTDHYETEPVIKLRADEKAYSLNFSDQGVKISRKGTNEVVASFDGTKPEVLKKASDWIDDSQDGFDNIVHDTSIKSYGMANNIELREVQVVPELGRQKVLKWLQKDVTNRSFDYTLDPTKDTSAVDKVYNIVMNQPPARAVSQLQALGLKLGSEGLDLRDRLKSAKSDILQLRADLALDHPNNAFFTVNSKTGKIIRNDVVPNLYMESPLIKNPFYVQNVFSGSAQSIRELLGEMKRVYSNPKVSNVFFKGRNVQITKNGVNRLFEVHIKIPQGDGALVDTVHQFTSLGEAHRFMTGATPKALKFALEDAPELQGNIRQFQKGLGKDAIKYKNDYMPFVYLAKQARDQGFYLGNYKGSYIMQDIMTDPSNIKLNKFKSLQEVSDWLKVNDVRKAMPNVLDISPEVLEEYGLHPKDLDPTVFNDFRAKPGLDKPLKETFGQVEAALYRVLPFDAAMNLFQNHKVTQYLRQFGAWEPVEIMNNVRKAVQTQGLWASQYKNYTHSLMKGFSQKQAEDISRYMESLDSLDEIKAHPQMQRLEELGHEFELRKDVLAELTQEHGTTKVAQMVDRADKLRKVYDQLFAKSGINPDIYIKGYVPRLKLELDRRGASMAQKFDIHELMGKGMPDTERKGFENFMRGVDFKEIAWERNIFKLTDSYIDVMAREKYLQPVLTELKSKLSQIKLTGAGKTADFAAFTDYMKDMMRTLMGIHGDREEAFKLAGQASLDAIGRKFNLPFKKNTFDLIGKLITSATGSFLAFRPFSVFKQLTQSLVTGAPFIGIGYWKKGLDKVLQPGSLKNFMKLGKIDMELIPTAEGFAMSKKGVLDKAIDVGMAPFKWGDWINRATIYYGAEARFNEHAANWMKYGAAYEKKFLKESGMMFFGKAQFNYMKKIMDTKPMGDALALVRDHVSTLAMSKTQFLYEKFEHPAMFRNGMGRLFGQFITWPVNYISLIADTFGSDTLSIGQKAKFLASTAAIGVGVATGLQAAGIKGDSFLPWNSVLFQGGPYYQMMNDLLGSISGGPDGSSHWRNFSRALVGLVPFSGEGTGVMRAIDAFKRGEAWEGFLHLTSAPIVLANHPKEAPNDLEKSLQDAGKLMFEGKTALDKMGTSGLGLLK